MNFDDFKIDEYFYTATGRWLCVDKGTKFILAVHENDLKPDASGLSWYTDGEESAALHVFDKWDFGGCDKVNRF